MGAESIAYIVKGKTAKDAYIEAREQAAWEHGHGGYTGTVAESSGYAEARPRTRYEASRAADRLLRDETVDGLTARKWEYAVMIPILPDKETRTAILPVDLTGLAPRDDDWRQDSPWLVAATAAARTKLRKDEHIMDLRLHTTAQSESYLKEYGTDEQKKIAAIVKHQVKPVIQRTKGERVTEYAVVSKHDYGRTDVLGVFPTLEAAKEEAVVRAANTYGSPKVGIIQQVRRDSGSGFLYDVSVATTKRTGAVEVTYGKRVAGAPTEFMMAGIYSS